MLVTRVILMLGSLSFFPTTTWGFAPNRHHHHHHDLASSQSRLPINTGHVTLPSNPPPVTRINSAETSTTLFENKLWDRMEIEEDDEPMWYVVNCVAGLEIDLLRQCRQRCAGMEDVEKFVVPMVTTTRSHGANRMVRETKVKYQGYVFAKLRLCPETYEAIQGLDLCRSWMGTVNYKGHKKLPPAPVALNEDEIENFGLEDLEAEEPEEPEGEENIILDSAEADQEAADIEETVQKVYKGLRVDDMVKVTAKNKFHDEDAVVRRLKGGKVFLRFYTYGSLYEEWMDPGDVRKLTSIEILKGLSGPQQPITQRDIDGPSSQGDPRGGAYGDDRGPRDRRNLQGAFGDGPRNRRQDRNAGRIQGDSQYDQKRNDDNWNWYKDDQRRNQGGAYDDGNNVEIRGSARDNQRGNRRDDGWAQGDVDSQWGRTTQRDNRRAKRQDSTNGGDWNALVSPTKDRPSQDETDDFFASLMTDLSNDLDSEKGPGASSNRKSDTGVGSTSSEDDFFASLISEIEEDSSSSPSKEAQSFDSGEDDFFASLAEEIQDAPKQKSSSNPVRETRKSRPGAENSAVEDDFFAALAEEIGEPAQQQKSKATGKESSAAELDDFFAGLDTFVGSSEAAEDSSSSNVGESDDFFANLEAELETQLSIETTEQTSSDSVDTEEAIDEFLSGLGGGRTEAVVETQKPAAKSAPKKANAPATEQSSPSPPKSIDTSSLDGCTVPVLKEMLREKGLKVSGKKSELIERLASQA